MKLIDIMGDITEADTQFLDKLLKDCITYRQAEIEALKYTN